MATLNSAELAELIKAAGIVYLPVDQIFYKDYPYKVELSPKFKGLDFQRKVGVMIDTRYPDRARQRMREFEDRLEKIIQNVEKRDEVIQFVTRMPTGSFKRRTGGENSLFYFKETASVVTLIETYPELIKSVSGPINQAHQNVISSDKNVMTRETLYYGKYRYQITFVDSEDFVKTVLDDILNFLAQREPGSWRERRLTTLKGYYEYWNSKIQQGYSLTSTTRQAGTIWRPRNAAIYLEDPEDYVYIKMLASEFIVSSQEIILLDELT